ncbi:MAG TPA: class I SAM-dependent methyltransferase [Candidatus Nanoarchaeia archaeon]|nr:class I SAM-dependent methyltransferase [Candidatus Nanoarchaeia archaeon]
MVQYRNDLIKAYIKDKDVLDVGSCGVDGFFFDMMKKHAKSITGLDLNGKGEIIKGDAETIDLHKTFDVVVAGDIIEHLNNVGLFLSNMHKHLRKGGTIIISTPNVKAWAYHFFKGNRDHTAWFCQYTLSCCLKRNGFKIKRITYCVRRKKGFLYDYLRYLFANNLFIVGEKA